MPASLVTMLDNYLGEIGADPEVERALVFTSPTGGSLRYSNFRKRVWYPAVDVSVYAVAYAARTGAHFAGCQ